MTISQDDLGSLPRVVVQIPDVADYDDGAWCPMCGHQLESRDVSTPDIPTHLLEDGGALEQQTVSVYGHECDRHRVDRVVLPVPPAFAPETYTAVDATIDGKSTSVAVPEVIFQEGSR